MTKEEQAIENFKEFIDHFQTQIKQAQSIGDKAFDVERAKRDIQTFEMAIQALSQEPCEDMVHVETLRQVMWERDIAIEQLKELGYDLGQKIESCEDAISRDFQIGDEVRIIGSDPIYDDCDVGWVIRNASEKIKTMYVMRNDGSAGEESKAEWYKTGRHNAMLAEVIKELPSVTPKPETVTEFADRCRECGKMRKGHWIHFAQSDDCSECGWSTGKYISPSKYCPNCGAIMVEQESEE